MFKMSREPEKNYDFAAQNGKSLMRCNDVTFYNIDFRKWIPGCSGLPTTKTTGNFFSQR